MRHYSVREKPMVMLILCSGGQLILNLEFLSSNVLILQLLQFNASDKFKNSKY